MCRGEYAWKTATIHISLWKRRFAAPDDSGAWEGYQANPTRKAR